MVGTEAPGAGGPADEDATLVVLARSAAARATGNTSDASEASAAGVAVRDDIGRTYAAGPVAVGPLRLTALQAAVAQAAASGVTRLEVVAVVGADELDDALLAAVGGPRVVRA